MRKTRRHSPEQIAQKLQEAEAMTASGKTTGQTCRGLRISKQTLYRWRAQNRGVNIAEMNRLRNLKDENQRLRRLVVDQALLIQLLQDAVGD